MCLCTVYRSCVWGMFLLKMTLHRASNKMGWLYVERAALKSSFIIAFKYFSTFILTHWIMFRVSPSPPLPLSLSLSLSLFLCHSPPCGDFIGGHFVQVSIYSHFALLHSYLRLNLSLFSPYEVLISWYLSTLTGGHYWSTCKNNVLSRSVLHLWE